MNTKTLSKYADVKWAIIQPCNGVVTKADQKKIDNWPHWRRTKFYAIHFPAKDTAATIERLKSLKLSKTYIVTIVTDAQWAARFNQPETLPDTGIHATKKQIAESFVLRRGGNN